MTWHQTIIVGNLGRDPEVRYFRDGNSVCSFGVAVNESWVDRRTGEPKERTTWYQVSAWGALGEKCERNLSRGSRVMVIGSVSVRPYINREGQPAASLDMRSREVRFLDGERDRPPSEDRSRQRDYDRGERGGSFSSDYDAPRRKPDFAALTQEDEDVYIPSSRGSDSFGGRKDEADDIPF